MQVQKFGVHSPKRNWGQKHAKFCAISDNFWIRSRISQERDKITKIERDVFTGDSSRVPWKKSGGLWSTNYRERYVSLGGSKFRSITFLFVDQSSQSFFAQRGKDCSWSSFFPIFDMWICSGDFCDQTRKLSEIALNFRRFLPSQILGGGPFPKIVPTWTLLPRGTSRGKVSWRYSH